MVTYLWEFFGPDALGVARHFEVHLLDFLKRHQLTSLETGVLAAPGQAVAFATLEPATGAAVTNSLRPATEVDGPLPEALRSAVVAKDRTNFPARGE